MLFHANIFVCLRDQIYSKDYSLPPLNSLTVVGRLSAVSGFATELSVLLCSDLPRAHSSPFGAMPFYFVNLNIFPWYISERTLASSALGVLLFPLILLGDSVDSVASSYTCIDWYIAEFLKSHGP